MAQLSYWEDAIRERINRLRALRNAALVGAGALALGVTGCSGGAGKSASPSSGLILPIADQTKGARRGGTLAQIMADSQPFDPVLTPSIPLCRFYGELLCLKGGYLEPAKGELEGDVAESWEYSPDKLQLTFKLSPKAHFAPLPPRMDAPWTPKM